MPNIEYQIMERIATISENTTGNYSIELNKTSYNGADPKLDLRKWAKDPERPLKGITLSDNEAEALMKALERYFAKKG